MPLSFNRNPSIEKAPLSVKLYDAAPTSRGFLRLLRFCNVLDLDCVDACPDLDRSRRDDDEASSASSSIKSESAPRSPARNVLLPTSSTSSSSLSSSDPGGVLLFESAIEMLSFTGGDDEELKGCFPVSLDWSLISILKFSGVGPSLCSLERFNDVRKLFAKSSTDCGCFDIDAAVLALTPERLSLFKGFNR